MRTPVRLVFLPVRVGYRTGRLLGIRRLLLLGIGVGIGLLVAPTSGAELRARLQRQLDDRRTGGGDLGDRVRHELSHSPRTWHLPQPTVEVVGTTAVLRGTVPHEVGRTDLERAAAAVAGVVDVDNLLVVSGTNGQS